jgi:ribosomal protein S18 acetylase RimI-like enzyme
MGKSGRFGKYGETKRLERLRQSGIRSRLSYGSDAKIPRRQSSFRGSPPQKTRAKTRLGKETDKDFIVHLSRKVFNIYGPYDDIVSEWLGSERTVTLIAALKGKPVGFAMMGCLFSEAAREQVYELLAIAVEPQRQRMGVGQMLMKDIEKKAIELGIKRLFLHTAEENRPAQSLFIRNGYRSWGIKKHFYPEGQDAVMMSKEICGTRI